LEVIDGVPDASLDLVYIDGDHTLRGITIDLLNVWKKVKAGGWIGGDDLSADIWQHSTRFEPTLVFPFVFYFAEAMGASIYALPRSQYLLEKPGGSKSAFACHDLVGSYGHPTLRLQMIAGSKSRSKLVPSVVRRGFGRLFGG
jgi:hypothetical protein